VFSARPGTIKQVIEINEPHPRKSGFMTSEKFTELRNTLFSLLHDEIRKAMEQSVATDKAASRKGTR
jgi:NitT/TauT family transport system ATP-binding protein